MKIQNIQDWEFEIGEDICRDKELQKSEGDFYTPEHEFEIESFHNTRKFIEDSEVIRLLNELHFANEKKSWNEIDKLIQIKIDDIRKPKNKKVKK